MKTKHYVEEYFEYKDSGVGEVPHWVMWAVRDGRTIDAEAIHYDQVVWC